MLSTCGISSSGVFCVFWANGKTALDNVLSNQILSSGVVSVLSQRRETTYLWDIIFLSCLCKELHIREKHVVFLRYHLPELFVFWDNGETTCCLFRYRLPQLLVCWANGEKQFVVFLKYRHSELFVFWAKKKQRVVYLDIVFRSCLCFGLTERNNVLSIQISSSRVVCVLG